MRNEDCRKSLRDLDYIFDKEYFYGKIDIDNVD